MSTPSRRVAAATQGTGYISSSVIRPIKFFTRKVGRLWHASTLGVHATGPSQKAALFALSAAISDLNDRIEKRVRS